MAGKTSNKKFESLLFELKEAGITKNDLSTYSKETLTAIKDVHEKVKYLEDILGKEPASERSITDLSDHMDELFRELRNKAADPTSGISSSAKDEKELKKSVEKLTDGGSNLTERQAQLGLAAKDSFNEMKTQTALLQSLVKNTNKSDFVKGKTTSTDKNAEEGVSILGSLANVAKDGFSKILGFLTSNPLLTMGIGVLVATIAGKLKDYLNDMAAKNDNAGLVATANKYEIKEDLSIDRDVEGASVEDRLKVGKGAKDGWFNKDDKDTAVFKNSLKSGGKTAQDIGQELLPRALRKDDKGEEITEEFLKSIEEMSEEEQYKAISARGINAMMPVFNSKGLPILQFTKEFLASVEKMSPQDRGRVMDAALLENGFAKDANDITNGWAKYKAQFDIKTVGQVKAAGAERLLNMISSGRGQVADIEGVVVSTVIGADGKSQVKSASAVKKILNISTLSDAKSNAQLSEVLRQFADYAEFAEYSAIAVTAGTAGWLIFRGIERLAGKASSRLAVAAGRRIGYWAVSTAAPFVCKAAAGIMAKTGMVVAGAGAAAATTAALVTLGYLAAAVGAVILAAVFINELRSYFHSLAPISEESLKASQTAQALNIEWKEAMSYNFMAEALNHGRDPGGTYAIYLIGQDLAVFEPISTAGSGMYFIDEVSEDVKTEIMELLASGGRNVDNVTWSNKMDTNNPYASFIQDATTSGEAIYGHENSLPTQGIGEAARRSTHLSGATLGDGVYFKFNSSRATDYYSDKPDNAGLEIKVPAGLYAFSPEEEELYLSQWPQELQGDIFADFRHAVAFPGDSKHAIRDEDRRQRNGSIFQLARRPSTDTGKDMRRGWGIKLSQNDIYGISQILAGAAYDELNTAFKRSGVEGNLSPDNFSKLYSASVKDPKRYDPYDKSISLAGSDIWDGGSTSKDTYFYDKNGNVLKLTLGSEASLIGASAAESAVVMGEGVYETAYVTPHPYQVVNAATIVKSDGNNRDVTK